MRPETYTYGLVFYWGGWGYWMTLYPINNHMWFCLCLGDGRMTPLLLGDSSFAWQEVE